MIHSDYPNIRGISRYLNKPRSDRLESMFEAFRHQDISYSHTGRVMVSLWLLLSLCFFQYRIAGHTVWSAPVMLFPQVNFSRPRWGDPLRILIQGLWLIAFRHSLRSKSPALNTANPETTPRPQRDLRRYVWLFK